MPLNRGVVSIVKNNYSGILLHDSSSYGIAFSIEEIVENYDYFVKNSKLHSKIIASRYGIENQSNPYLILFQIDHISNRFINT